jgi:hypothetical protein
MELITQNSKIKKTSKVTGWKVFNWGIPAYQSKTGLKTCPNAGACKNFCFGCKGAYKWSNVSPAFEKRLQISQQPNFVDLMQKEIERKKVDILRVHDIGDYYSTEYFNIWLEIARRNPLKGFYSYTNEVKLIKGAEIPDNYCFIFSTQGRQSHLINKETDRHATIFKTLAELTRAGYTSAMDNDLKATKWFTNSNRIGLIYH